MGTFLCFVFPLFFNFKTVWNHRHDDCCFNVIVYRERVICRSFLGIDLFCSCSGNSIVLSSERNLCAALYVQHCNDTYKFVKRCNNATIHTSDNSKKSNFATPKVKKKQSNLTIDLLALGVYAPGPEVLTNRPKFCGSSNLHSAPGSGPGTKSKIVPVYQDRKVITLRSGVLDQN